MTANRWTGSSGTKLIHGRLLNVNGRGLKESAADTRWLGGVCRGLPVQTLRALAHSPSLITDCALLDINYGWDESDLDGDDTPVTLLSEERRREEWQRYSVGSEDLDLDPDKHVLVLGG